MGRACVSSTALSVFSISIWLLSCNAVLPDLELEPRSTEVDTSIDKVVPTDSFENATDSASTTETSTDSDTLLDTSPGSDSSLDTGTVSANNGYQCSEDSDCLSGHCSNNVCCAAGMCCNPSFPCAKHLLCNYTSFTCAESCALSAGSDIDGLCVDGFHCDAGACIVDLQSGQCDENSDCMSGECVSEACCEHAGLCCASNDDCPELFAGCATDNSRTCVYTLVQLPATGQKECWNVANEVVDCSVISSNQDLFGQTGHYAQGDKQFTLSGNVITDTVTGLVWMSTPSLPMDYDGAQMWCQQQQVDGRVNWRLPTRTELLSLQNYSPAAAGGVSDMFAIPDNTEVFWSSTPLAGDFTATVWVINFSDGTVTRLSRDAMTPAALCVTEELK
ncbi:MAG: DUF1566 domain-containing protein [Deltaproteobacteria bacterium]|nr:DUF1566 domain-containing protein [Deltaproteobacteria bacterium]